MAYDEGLAQRIRESMSTIPDVTEKKMFGGIAFMVRGHMCCGVVKSDLMVRIGKDRHDDALKLPHAREMDFTKKPMKGFLYVSEEGVESDTDLDSWIERAHEFVRTLPNK